MGETNYATVTSDKSKITALLLCIFVGYLGIHHFYVGRIGKGILYLFTGGLFVLVGGLISQKSHREHLQTAQAHLSENNIQQEK